MVKRTQSLAIEGATPANMPGFIKPQLATLRPKAPKGPQWLHEIKFDGYRVQVHLNKGKKKVFTRNGLDWTKRFSVIAGALDLPGHAIIDGEVVVIKDGRTNFSELQAELAAGRQDKLVFYAFDVLYLNGFEQLDTVVNPKSKLTKLIRKPKATWVEPSFMAEVEFRDVTSDGLLRQSSFKGLSKKTPRN
jgi:ATP-dependent DNA ligase